MGPDDLLIRINEGSVLAWLSAKVERATKRFTELAGGDEGRASGWAGGGSAGGSGGFAKNFQTIASSPSDARRDKEVQAECRQRALEAVCEYLGDEWATKLAEKFRCVKDSGLFARVSHYYGVLHNIFFTLLSMFCPAGRLDVLSEGKCSRCFAC